LKELLPLIPAHRTYCEPFAGGLAVFLAKPKSQVEIINDLNGDLVSLYRCAQWHLEALINEVAMTLQARKNVLEMVDQPGLTELQRAARFLLVNRGSFAGGMTSYGVYKSQAPPSRRAGLEALERLNARLDAVSVENVSYERCLELYDGPETFFFLDPPYLGSGANTYRGWTVPEMTGFASRVRALEGRWVVTVDDSPTTRSLFRGCQIRAVRTRNGSVNQRTHGGTDFGELIIQPPRRKEAAGVLKMAA
jgi:DNA adenine methylase